MELTLEPPGEDEIVVSGPGMYSVFVGLGSTLAKRVNSAIGALGAESPEIQVGGVTFHRRIAGARFRVWVFKRGDVEKVASFFGLRVKPGEGEQPALLTPDEIGISQSDVSEYFVGSP